MRIVLVICLAGALLAACGQRGPLSLPGAEREKVDTTTPVAAPSPAPGPDTTATDESEGNTRRNRAN